MSQSANVVLLDAGVAAFRDRQFTKAVQNLQTVLDTEPDHWRARMYLAMSYFQMSDPLLALHHFRYLTNNCTDSEIRQKAQSAIQAIGKLDQSALPEMSCRMVKPTFDRKAQPSPSAEVEEVEWVPTAEEAGYSRK